ncbi:O-antigen ligase family protein [Bacteroides sp. AN502(2024)]|uniref:O-antigen ligase family protein n=1 Tax=Bacteroides sp. AN502(2024) TaxID=3160599 RepID=UPI003514454C
MDKMLYTNNCKKRITLLKNILIFMSIFSFLETAIFSDIYLNSFIFFAWLSIITSISFIFLISIKRCNITCFDISILALIIIQILVNILNNTLIIYHQSIIKMLVLLLWMISLRNLCRNNYRNTTRIFTGILIFWMIMQLYHFIITWGISNFIFYNYYNSVSYSILFSFVSSFLIIQIFHSKLQEKKRFPLIALLIGSNIFVFANFNSRTLLLVLVATCIYVLYKIDKKKKIIIMYSILFFSTLLIAFTYKTESSMGRMFIWKNTLHILYDNLVSGIGIGKFPTIYMEYQVNYFTNKGITNKYSLLAGNTSFAYNDILEFLCKFGILQCFTAFTCLYLTYKECIKKSIYKNIIFLLSLIALTSCFNYTMQILFIQVFVICLLALLKPKHILKLPSQIGNTIVFILVCTLGIFYFHLYPHLNSKQTVLFTNSNKKILETTPSYLVHEAFSNFAIKEYDSCIQNLNKLFYYAKTDELELLYGKSYKELGLYNLAEKSFQRAINMYPSKYINRYELMLLYKEYIKDHTKGINVAKEIININEKIPTGLSKLIINSAISYIKEKDENYFSD